MEIKRVSCPKCGIVLDVSNNKNEVVKRFEKLRVKCPNCSTELRVHNRKNMPYRQFHCPTCQKELRISFIKPAE